MLSAESRPACLHTVLCTFKTASFALHIFFPSHREDNDVQSFLGNAIASSSEWHHSKGPLQC